MNGLLKAINMIVTMFARSVGSSPMVSEKKKTQMTPNKTPGLLTLNDLITSSNKYPERAKSKELTQDVLENLKLLLAYVNPFLADLGLKSVKVSSGFRPSDVNSNLPNSAKRSLHMLGKAVDLEDTDGTLDALIESRDDLKKRYGLWQESPASTSGWSHIDIGIRSAREKNTFLP